MDIFIYCLDLFTQIPYTTCRSNIGNAKLGGLEEDLNMTKSEYQWSLSIFYFSYVIFDLPSNIIMRRWRPSHWLGILMLYVFHLMPCVWPLTYTSLVAAGVL